MSGLLGAVSSGLQSLAINSVANFLLSAPPVMLGPVVFTGLETPEKAPWGGKQKLVVHKLVGGLRVIDAMGRDDMDISWSGILEGPLATPRALQLDQLRVQGNQLPLTWDVLSWTVVVGEFKADYTRLNWIPYSISCVVVQDNSAQLAGQAPTLGVAVLQDVAQAQATATGYVQSALSGATAAVTSAL